MANTLYNAVRFILRPFYDLVFPRTVTGMENLPAEGGFILCVNHCSAHDPLFVATRLPLKREMRFMGKKELFKNRLFGFLLKKIGGIPVDRGNADLAAVRSCLQALKDGCGLLIFPQGTRSPDNSPTPMLTGAAMIALRGGVPVIPCYIGGPYRAFRRMPLRFGSPLDFSDFGRRCDRNTLEEATARISDAVWALRDGNKT